MALSKINTGGLAADAVDNTILDLADDFAGMHFGGTGSSNQFDDYEYGTWTATLGGTSSDPTTAVTVTANYTKVGRVVSVRGTFTNVGTTGASGGVEVRGLPFTAYNTHASGNLMTHTGFTLNAGASNVSPYIADNSTTMRFYQSLNQTVWSQVFHHPGSSGRYLYFTATYQTAQ